ncbi:hypothetical protein SAMN05428971_4286 [Candidatus Pantoea varia]|uniref:Uncharacterized protein n=1 Tax=Candidatus Pantoea varia TaxID=1881036 RepID=A0A1I5HS72_9GAMM|nr:hypothetical protein SAMN05428971_4286 [Pantoea varia]
MSSTLMRYYIVHYVYALYPGRVFKKLIVFKEKILESSLRKYFVKEKEFAILTSGDVQRNKK